MRKTTIVVLVFAFVQTIGALGIASAPIQLAAKPDQATFETFIRQTNNATLIELIPRMVFYNEVHIPRLFQIDEFSSFFTGFFISPGGSGFFEPNTEFPWTTPAGLRQNSNAANFKFVVFPEPKDKARALDEKIQWWTEMVAPAAFNAAIGGIKRWIYPVGTVFGEVLLVRNEKNEHVVFEVRTRTKKQAGYAKGWDMESYRPFPTAESLLVRLQQLIQLSQFSGNPAIEGLMTHLTTKKKLPLEILSDTSNTTKRAFGSRTVAIDKLPAISNEAVMELLTNTSFEASTGSYWLDEGDKSPSAPATDAPFHIVPRNANLAFIHTDNGSCMTCHDSAGEHARKFAFNAPSGNDWYGFVRGSDAIFSFQFMNRGNSSKSIKQEFVNAGLIQEIKK